MPTSTLSLTQVHKVIVGTPVKRVQRVSDLVIANAADVDGTSQIDGGILVYNSSRAVFEYKTDLGDVTINGGTF